MKFKVFTRFLIALIVISLSVLGDSAVANVAGKGYQEGQLATLRDREELIVHYEEEPAHPSEALTRNIIQTRALLGEEALEATSDDSNGISRQASSIQERRPKGCLALIVIGSFLFGTAIYLRREKSPHKATIARL